MIIVSHRGPYQFSRTTTASSSRTRARAASSARSRRCSPTRRDATWIAAAMSDDDRAAGRPGTIADLDVNVRLLDLDREQHRMHYEVVANGVLWFLHHGMFDRSRRPRFDLRFRDAWDAFVAVNQHVRRRRRAERARGRDRARAGLPALPRPPVSCASSDPTCASCTSRTRPSRPRRPLGAARPTSAPQLCASLASGPAGFHTRRWADAYRQSARAALGRRRERSRRRSSPASAPTSPRSKRSPARPARAPPRRTLADAVGDRLVIARSDRIEPSKNIVRGFLAYDRLLEARPGPAGPGRVRRDGVPVAPGTRRVPRVRERGRTGRSRASTTAGRHATGSRSCSTTATTTPVRSRACSVTTCCSSTRSRDGLNLVAKEGPVVNRRDGVLCLSPEAGAYEELKAAALRVHPYDLEQCAGALDDALSMPLDERAARASKLRTPRDDALTRRLARRSRRPRGSVAPAARSGRRRRGRPRPAQLGRRFARRHADAHRARQPPVGDGLAQARRTRGGRRSRRPRTRRPSKPSTSACVGVPLSTSIGGRSSTAMRVCSSASPCLARRPRAATASDVVGLIRQSAASAR